MIHYKPKDKEEEDDIKEAEKRLFSDADLKHITRKNFEESRQENDSRETRESRGNSSPAKILKKEDKKEQRENRESQEWNNSNSGWGNSQRQITFSFNPQKITRVLFAVLFIFLAVSFFYNPFYSMFPWNNGIDGNVVATAVEKGIGVAQDTDKSAENTEETETKETASKESKELDETDTKENTEETSEPTENSGLVTLSIEEIKTQKTEWGGKITEVSFKVENRLETFKPKIRAYAYDDKDQKTKTDYKAAPVVQTFAPLQKDKMLRGKLSLTKFPFDETTRQKTVIVQLYDEGEEAGSAHDKKLAEITQNVLIK